MRPYLAILKDSVREAVRSRTLPFLLLFFTLVLAAVAPLGLKDETAWRLDVGDVRDAPLLAARLRRDAAKEGEQPGDRVLERLPGAVRKAVLEPDEDGGEPEDFAERLRDALNADVLPSPDLYDETAFAGVNLAPGFGGFGRFGGGGDDDDEADRGEAERLIAAGPASLPPEKVGRLNRLLVQAAFPGTLTPPAEERVSLTYAGYDITGGMIEEIAGGSGMKLNRSGVRLIGKALLSAVTSYLAGPIGVLIGVLVTASLIPQTFEGGAIDLLLSKPVNRSLAFLTKFAGGCVFVGLAALYLCGGLWLIAGVRLGVWDAGVVASAGVLVTQFAVIYSVSAAVGVLWRNPIVCIMCAVAVWAGSWALRQVYTFSELYYETRRPAAVLEVDGPDGAALFSATNAGTVRRWDGGEWEPALYEAGGRPPGAFVYSLSGPVYAPETGTLSAVEIRSLTPPRPGSAVRKVTGSRRYYTATAEDDWEGKSTATAPPGTGWLLLGEAGRPLFAGTEGVFALTAGDGSGENGAGEGGGFFADLVGGLRDRAVGPFTPLAAPPGGETWPEPFAAAADPATGAFAVYAGGVLRTYGPDGGEPTREVVLYEPPPAESGERTYTPAVLPVMSGGTVLLVTADGTGKRVVAGGAVSDFTPVPGERPAAWSVAEDGTLALRTHDRSVWVGDASPAGGVVYGDASAAGWATDGGLWVGTSADRVTKLSAGDWDETRTVGPSAGWYELVYRYGLIPLHYLLPDTPALGAVVGKLFTSGDGAAAFAADLDLREPSPEIDVTGPLIHNLAFLAAILALTCWHVSRTDF